MHDPNKVFLASLNSTKGGGGFVSAGRLPVPAALMCETQLVAFSCTSVHSCGHVPGNDQRGVRLG
jgi:hypothetical protein